MLTDFEWWSAKGLRRAVHMFPNHMFNLILNGSALSLTIQSSFGRFAHRRDCSLPLFVSTRFITRVELNFAWKVVTSAMKDNRIFYFSLERTIWKRRFHALELRKFGFWTLGLCWKSNQTSTNSVDYFPFVSVWKQWRRFGLEGYTQCFWPQVVFFVHGVGTQVNWRSGLHAKLLAQARAATETSVSDLWLVLSPRRLTPFEFQRQTAIKSREKCGESFSFGISIWRKVEGFLRSFAVPALYWV